MKFNKKWLPAIIAPSIIATTAFAVPMSAFAVDLPDLTPQQVVLLMDEKVPAFSGTIVKTSNLGLPSFELSSMVTQDMIDEMSETMPEGMGEFIPQALEQNPLMDAIALLSGTHRIRVYASDEGARIQILDPMSQRDLIINNEEFWIYDSRKATATNGTFTAEVQEISPEDQQKMEEALNSALDEYSAKLQLNLRSPEAVADYLIGQADKDAEISVGRDHRIAGRTAYQLIINPDAANTLIDSVVISVDSETGVALDVKVYSVEFSKPAFHIGFTDIDFNTPDADLFTFTPPAGTTVTQLNDQLMAAVPAEDIATMETLMLQAKAELDELENLSDEQKEQAKQALALQFEQARAQASALGIEEPSLLGSGWESILYIPAIPEQIIGDLTSHAASTLPINMSISELSNSALLETEIFADMFTEIPGGKAFTTPVFNVAIMDNGDIYMGSVTLEYLISQTNR
jgi:outer membrane lipoprotein-sorting protein